MGTSRLGARPLMLTMMLLAGCTETGSSGDGSCVSNRDCRGDEVCLGGTCQSGGGGGRGCERNSDCPSGTYCDVASATCQAIQPQACTMDTQCPPQQRCNVTSGICVDGDRPCTAMGECAGNLMCDMARMRCVECLVPTDCIAPAMCMDGFCVDPNMGTPDAGMMSTPDAGGVGDPDGSMSPMCTMDTECLPPQTICEGGMCVPGCGVNSALCAPGTEVCDTNTGRCVPLTGPCQSDATCGPPNMVCESGQCVPGCAQVGGIQCSGGMVCEPATGRCVMGGPICRSDADCNPPSTICNLSTGQCDPGCQTTGCTAPAMCNTTTGRCEGGMQCQDDTFEDNDTRQTATMSGASSLPVLGACPNDDDWYSVSLTGGSMFSVDLTFQHGDGNIDVELQDSNGAVVASSRTNTDNELLSYNPMTAGTYYIRVFLQADMGPSPGNQYGMNIMMSGPSCVQDMLEPNNTAAQASPLSPGIHSGLNVCTGDDDYISFPATVGQVIDISVVSFFIEGDVDIELLDPAGTVVARSMNIVGGESINHTATTAGTYVLRVYLSIDLGSTPGNSYVLQFSVGSGASAMCMPDSFEPNETQGAASAITAGMHSVTACDMDEDWYSIALTAGQQISVDLTFGHTEGDIDLHLRDPGGTLRAFSTSVTDNENLTHTVSTAGTWFIRTWLYRDTGNSPGNTYTMNITVQ